MKDKILKFLKNCGTFAIKESEGGESIIYGSLNSKINCFGAETDREKKEKGHVGPT